MSVIFEFDGCEYMALDAGPHFKLNETFSLLVSCKDQAGVDRFWDAHSDDC